MPLMQPYRGRFAPSPTGPLHFGSMATAIGSYLQARSLSGEWLVRIENVDPFREAPGATAAILRTLERFGLCWDGEVLYQSQRRAAYLNALDQLRRDGLTYYCRCSRSDLAASHHGHSGRLYPGHCRMTQHQSGALRVQTHDDAISFVDGLQGRFSQHLESEVGDFVVCRADGIFAYQLAVVVDDAAQGVSEVVRGGDLLDNTPRQIYLQHLLGYPTPNYIHLPIAINAEGQKLSKQAGAMAIENCSPTALLMRVLRFLGQQPPNDLAHSSLDEMWRWAIAHWQRNAIPATARPVELAAC